MNARPAALVLGGYLTVLGTLRCMAAARIPRHCMNLPEAYVRASRHYRGPPLGADPIASPAELGDYLQRLPLESGVLMPCSDEWALACAALAPELLERFPFCGPRLPVMQGLLDKSQLEERLRELQIAHPRTRPARDEADLDWLAAEPNSIWFLKPADSQAFRRCFGRKAIRVGSVAEANEVLARCREHDLAMLLQEYIPGPADRHYLVDGFVDHDAQLLSIVARRRLRMHPHDFGDSSFLVSVPLAELPEPVDACRRLLTQGSFRGIFSAEFKRDPRDERFKLIEVNTRPWAYVQFAASCGFNAPAMAYRDALGLAQPDPAAPRLGARFQIMPNDLKALLELRRRGELGLLSWMAQSWGSESALFKADDPLPALVEFGNTLRSAGGRALGRR